MSDDYEDPDGWIPPKWLTMPSRRPQEASKPTVLNPQPSVVKERQKWHSRSSTRVCYVNWVVKGKVNVCFNEPDGNGRKTYTESDFLRLWWLM